MGGPKDQRDSAARTRKGRSEAEDLRQAII